MEANVARAAREADRLPGPAPFPHQLLAERPAALAGGRVPDRPAGRGARPGRAAGPPLRAAARHRQGGRPRDGGRPPGRRRRADPALRRVARRSCTRRWATTTTCGSRRRTPCSSPPPTPSAPAVPVPAARPWRNTSGGWRSSRRWPCGFPGVEQAYAIQAGREIRVIVDSQQLDDAASAKVCRDIARSIQEQLTYPGEVKVTVLRETRARSEFARVRR